LWALRKSLNDAPDSTEALVKRLKQAKTNEEFLDSLELKSPRQTTPVS
jgi:transcription termination factor Rho